VAIEEVTPTEQQQPITGVATLESVGFSLCTVGSGFIAGAEVHRGRSHAQQEVFLRESADRLRNLRHFLSEAEQLLIAIAGYGSGREIRRVVSDPVTHEGSKSMNKLDGLSGSLMAGAATVTATEPFGPIWSKVAAGVLAVAAFFAARMTPVKPKAQS
jgi:hypothetical protein